MEGSDRQLSQQDLQASYAPQGRSSTRNVDSTVAIKRPGEATEVDGIQDIIEHSHVCEAGPSN